MAQSWNSSSNGSSRTDRRGSLGAVSFDGLGGHFSTVPSELLTPTFWTFGDEFCRSFEDGTGRDQEHRRPPRAEERPDLDVAVPPPVGEQADRHVHANDFDALGRLHELDESGAQDDALQAARYAIPMCCLPSAEII